MNFFYRVFYHPLVNKILRTALKGLHVIGVKRITLPVSGKLQVKVGEVPSFSLSTNQSNYLTREIFWKGPANYEYTPLFIHLIKNTSVFLDIGANIGYYSLLAARVNPACSIYAFEPGKGPYHYLARNIKGNNLNDQVKFYPLALSSSEGDITFFEHRSKKYAYLDYQLSGTSNLENSWGLTEIEEYKVKTTMLDSFMEENNIEQVDIIKIDTEGTEHIIFAGATHTLSNLRPLVISEVLAGKVERQMEEIFKKHHYRFVKLGDKDYKESTTLVDAEGADNNWLLIPSEQFDEMLSFLNKLP